MQHLLDHRGEDEVEASRRGFLGRAAGAAALALPAAWLGRSASAATRPRQPTIGPVTAQLFRDIRQHENDHVAFLVNALGSQARPKPTFQNLVQPNFQSFLTTATILENVGVGAYLGALPLLSGTNFLQPAGTIAQIEARHAGALNTTLGLQVTANQAPGADKPSFETPLIPEGVVDLAMPFIASLNGGPPPLPLNNPIDVLNFALILEYLEAEFYNLNVSRFIG